MHQIRQVQVFPAPSDAMQDWEERPFIRVPANVLQPERVLAADRTSRTLSSPLVFARRASDSVMLVSLREAIVGRGSCEMVRRSASTSSAAALASCSAPRAASTYTHAPCIQ